MNWIADRPVTIGVATLGWVRLLVRQLRLYQWAKNALLFIPLLAAHRLGDHVLWVRTLLAFLSFGLVASSVYVLNDLSDLEADRRHPRKRFRPLASGELPAGVGKALVPTLLVTGAAVALQLPREFGFLLAGYWLTTLGYSLGLKKRPILDVTLLAGLYTVRVYAGGAATGVPVSECIASGYLAVLVLALYISSQDVRRLYAHPSWLWLLCPLVLYWLSDLWLHARRGKVDDDPLLFALRDPSSWVVAALAAIVVWIGV